MAADGKDGEVVFQIRADDSHLEADLEAANSKVKKKSEDGAKAVTAAAKGANAEVISTVNDTAKSFDKVAAASKKVDKALDFDTSGVREMIGAQDNLNAKIEVQSRILGNLEKDYARVVSRQGENSKESLKLQNQMLNTSDNIGKMVKKSDDMTASITKAETAAKGGTKGLNDLGGKASTAKSGVEALGKGAKNSADSVKKLGNESAKASGTVNKLGSVASGIGKAFAGAVVAGAGAAAVAVIKLGVSFENSMAKASTLIDTTAVDMDKLGVSALELSNKTGIAADELGNTMYNALSAGIKPGKDGADVLAFMGENAKLAKAGFTDIDTAVTTTAKVLNAYKMDVSDTDRVHKVLMQTQNNGITTVGELGQCLAQVTPTAAAMGVSFEQVGAALANLTAQGTPAAQATTQLNALFSELGKKGTNADKVLRNLTATTKAATASELATLKEGFDGQEKAYSKSLDGRVRAAEKSYNSGQKALDKSLAAETKAFEKASDAKLALIDKEYTERLKVIDEEKYNQIKALDDQINQINGLTEAEQKAAKEKENAEKLAELRAKVSTDTTSEARQEASKSLADFEENLRLEKLSEERKAQIDALKSQKDVINEEADKKKEALKAESDVKKEALSEEISIQKEALKEKQDNIKESFSEQRQLAMDNIRETNAADLEAFKATNAEKLELTKSGSGDGKGFSDLLAEGKTLNEIIDMLGVEAGATDETLIDMFGSLEAGKAALSLGGENSAKFAENLKAMGSEADVVGDAYGKVTETTGAKFNLLLENLKNAAIGLFEGLSPIIDVLQAIAEPMVELIKAVLPPLTEAFNILLKPLLDIVKIALKPLKEIFALIAPLIEAVMPVITELARIFSEVLGAAIKIVLPIIESITDVLGGVIDFISGIFSGNWDKAWKGIVEIFKGVFNLIPTIIEGILNGAIGLINKLIGGINLLTGVVGIPPIPDIPEVKIPRFKVGVDYVPSDFYPAFLDKGEAVLTESEADIYRRIGGKGSLERLVSSPSASPAAGMNIAQILAGLDSGGGSRDTNVTVNNYSPKALNAWEIEKNIRQTAQQLRRL